MRDAVSSAGAPLDDGLRATMERGFATDLSGVRVHSDERARRANASLHSRALSAGDHIVLGGGARPGDPALLAHELAHVVQYRAASGVVPGVGSRAPLEREADAAGSGHAVTGSPGVVPAVQLAPLTLNGSGVQVVVDSGVVTLDGKALPATVEADGRITYNGREIVFDRSGVFRYRDDRYLPCRPCNPHLYEGKRWSSRPGVVAPESSGSFWDPVKQAWVLRTEPVVTIGKIVPSPQPAQPAALNPRLKQEMETARFVRDQFEARVERAMTEGGLSRADAERVVRQRMQQSMGQSGMGAFETGQTYAVVETEAGPGVTRRSTTAAVAGGELPSVNVQLAETRARLAEINKTLGENFVFTEQNLQHAEVRGIVRTPGASAYYVQRGMCVICQRFFLLEAMAQKRMITVWDGSSTWVFTPDRRVVEYQGTLLHERTATITRAGGASTLEIGATPSVTHSVTSVARTGPVAAPETVPAAGAAAEAEAAALAKSGKPVVAPEGAAPPAPKAAPLAGKLPAGALKPKAGFGGTLARGGRGIGRFAVGAVGATALNVLSLAAFLVEVIFRLVVLPRLEEEHRAYLGKQIQDYYERNLRGPVENAILSLAEHIRAIEDRDAQPYVNVAVKVHFKRSWSWLSGQGYGPPESIRDLDFVRLSEAQVEISDTPVPEHADEMVAEDTIPVIGDTFSTEFGQTIHFSGIPPSYQDFVDHYGPNPASKATRGCFIATACYGTPAAPQVAALRRFRDRHLMTRAAGRRFVDWYYRTSPPIADALERHPVARWAVRNLLVAPLATAVRACQPDRGAGPLFVRIDRHGRLGRVPTGRGSWKDGSATLRGATVTPRRCRWRGRRPSR